MPATVLGIECFLTAFRPIDSQVILVNPVVSFTLERHIYFKDVGAVGVYEKRETSTNG